MAGPKTVLERGNKLVDLITTSVRLASLLTSTLDHFRLVLPLVNRQTVNIMNAGANMSDTTDLSTFGFLYGTIPAAPGTIYTMTDRFLLSAKLKR